MIIVDFDFTQKHWRKNCEAELTKLENFMSNLYW